MAHKGRHLAPKIRRISRTWVVPLTLVMTLVMGGVALADTIVVNDLVTGADATKSPGSSGSIQVYLIQQNDSNGTHIGDRNGCNAGSGDAVTVNLTSNNSKVTVASPGYVTIAECDNPLTSGREGAATLGYTVAADATAGTVTISGVATGGKSDSLFNNDSMTVTVEIAVTNQAPSQPGTPAGSSPNQGVFTLGWNASSDDGLPAGSSISYTLQHKDTDDAAFSTVATDLATNSYSFTAASPEAEGTWTYRVIASDGSLSSTPSADSDVIKVDQSAPNAPSLSADRAPEDSAGDWFKNTVTVSFSDNGDPNLDDGSAGSGVNASTIPADVTKNTSGSHTISGTLFDNVGLESDQGSLTVKVDATAPTVSFGNCPSQPLLLNSTASASWSAADLHSGLASATSGTATLDTSTVGSRSATTTATDKVGLSTIATCNYSVIYDFDGFFSPVENPSAWNSAKAGQSIPVKFSLSGDQGLTIFDAAAPYNGGPRIVQVACPNDSAPDPIEEYATATANSKLIYDSSVDQYNYVWKTDKTWTGKCFRLDVKLIDGTIHSANFKFTK